MLSSTVADPEVWIIVVMSNKYRIQVIIDQEDDP